MTPKFRPGEIRDKYGVLTDYYSKPGSGPLAARLFPSLYFYLRLAAGPVQWIFRRGLKGQCDDAAWTHASAWVSDILEESGCRLEIEGQANLCRNPGPCVFVGNHMSTLETFILPSIIRPRKCVTFVVKSSLVKMPLFGNVMRSRDPIVVERKNPRKDFEAIVSGGKERLARGISLVIFPQATRTSVFDRKEFNSIGVKLARQANVPIIPVALKTDAWGQGAKIKEAGRIRPDLPVRIKFGAPVIPSPAGKVDHENICDFIESTVCEWQKRDGVNPPG